MKYFWERGLQTEPGTPARAYELVDKMLKDGLYSARQTGDLTRHEMLTEVRRIMTRRHLVIAELDEGLMMTVESNAPADAVTVVEIDWDEIKRGSGDYLELKVREVRALLEGNFSFASQDIDALAELEKSLSSRLEEATAAKT